MIKKILPLGAALGALFVPALSWYACDGLTGQYWDYNATPPSDPRWTGRGVDQAHPIFIACVSHNTYTQRGYPELLGLISLFSWTRGKTCGASPNQLKTAQMLCAGQMKGRIIERDDLGEPAKHSIQATLDKAKTLYQSPKDGKLYALLSYGGAEVTLEALSKAYPEATALSEQEYDPRNMAVDYNARVVYPSTPNRHSAQPGKGFYSTLSEMVSPEEGNWDFLLDENKPHILVM